MAHAVRTGEIDGHRSVTLVSPAGVEATFAPGVGMIGCSLRADGEELLGQRHGLAGYARTGSTMGIPLLHPWANRLSGLSYEAGGVAVTIDPSAAPVRLDGNGLPIHGLLAAAPWWEDVRTEAGDAAVLSARLDFGARPELLAAFPFPHVIALEARLDGRALTITTTIEPTGDRAVPVAFGFHPYLQIPGAPRAAWELTLPVRTHAVLDGRGIPAGADEPAGPLSGPLGDRTFDDLYPALDAPAVFAFAAAGRRVEVRFGPGFPVAQLYAPPGEPFLACEPMTAPTNALASGNGLRLVAPGERFAAAFTVAV